MIDLEDKSDDFIEGYEKGLKSGEAVGMLKCAYLVKEKLNEVTDSE